MSRFIFLALLVLVIILGLLDVGKQWMDFSNSRHRMRGLKISLQQKKRIQLVNPNVQPSLAAIDKEKIMNLFFSMAKESGLITQSVWILNNSGLNQLLTIDSVFMGSFSQLIEFINKISHACFPVRINRAELFTDHNQLRLKLKIDILDLCVRSTLNRNFSFFSPQKNKNNPFEKVLTNLDENQNDSLQLFSIKQLKFAGYLKQSKQMMAVVTLPDGRSRTIAVGDQLGIEHAYLVDINESGMVFQLNKKNFKRG